MRFARLLATASITAILSQTALAASFPDVQKTRYVDAFAYLNAAGVVQGYADGSGRPFQGLNRAEALKVVLELQPRLRERVAYFKQHLPAQPLFYDVDQTSWYAPYVEAGFEAGIVGGYPDGSFRPANFLKTEEAIALLLRSVGKDKVNADAGAAWYQPSLNFAKQKNLLSKYDSFPIGGTITRGQFFDVAYRLVRVTVENLTAFVEPPPPAGTVGQNGGTSSAPDPSKGFSITIPDLGITNMQVIHPADPFTSKGLLAPLTSGLGHLFSFPGMGGKVMIYGHSSSYSWDISEYTKIFRRVNELDPGDRVQVTFNGKVYNYEVTHEKTIPASDMSAFQGRGEELILYTCWPPDSIKERYLVFAKPI